MTSQIKPEQIRWRVGSIAKSGDKAMLLGYIDSRTAMELLDDLDAEWSDAYSIVKVDGSEGIECSLTVKGVTRTDVGVPSNTEGLKGAYSDALKRAAVKHGIGRELYELPRIWVNIDQYKRPVAEPTFARNRWTLPSGSGSVFYDRDPDEQPQDGERDRSTGKRSPATTRPAVQRSSEEQALLDELLTLTADKGREYQSRLADEVGVPEGQHANADQLREMIALAIGHAAGTVNETPAAARAAGADGSPLPVEELSEAGSVPTAGRSSNRTSTEEAIARARRKAAAADKTLLETAEQARLDMGAPV